MPGRESEAFSIPQPWYIQQRIQRRFDFGVTTDRLDVESPTGHQHMQPPILEIGAIRIAIILLYHEIYFAIAWLLLLYILLAEVCFQLEVNIWTMSLATDNKRQFVVAT